jgi:phosphatidylglycerophosphate synthase
MFDSRIRRHIDPVSDKIGRRISRLGVRANTVTAAGFVFGLVAFAALLMGEMMIALVFIILNRIADGLDGAVARHQGVSDLGGYLDIVTDFIFYALVPLGFALADPDKAQAAAFLVVSFIGTGSSFLAFAIIAAKRGVETSVRGKKSIYYIGGLTEGTETIALLVLMCLFPQWFNILAWGFGMLCWITTATRVYEATITFGEE